MTTNAATATNQPQANTWVGFSRARWPEEVAFAEREALRLRIATPVDREVSLRVQVARMLERLVG